MQSPPISEVGTRTETCTMLRVSVYVGAAGKAEPVGLDGKGEQVLDVRTITLESRELEGDDDRVVRRSLHAASGQRLRDIADKVRGMISALNK